MELRFSKTSRYAITPTRASLKKDAGLDLYTPSNFKETILLPGESILIDLNIKINLPASPLEDHEYYMQIANKSGVSSSGGTLIAAGVVDPSYQGSVHVCIVNTTKILIKKGKVIDNGSFLIKPGMAIAQGIILLSLIPKLIEIPEDKLYTKQTQRGSQGFGSNYRHVEE